MLVYAGIHLRANNFAHFVIDTWGYQNVLLNPGCVCDDGDFDGWKEVLTEMMVLRFAPSKSFILE